METKNPKGESYETHSFPLAPDSAILFEEKIDLWCIVGISLAFLALLLINMNFVALLT